MEILPWCLPASTSTSFTYERSELEKRKCSSGVFRLRILYCYNII